MHRSGTSCVGNLLTRMGVYFGNEEASIPAGTENPKGFFERRDLRDICDAILQGSGCDWWAVSDFSPERVPAAVRTEVNASFAKTLEELQQHQPWFIKEPRLCLIWPVLSASVTNPVFIHVWRDPLEVAHSLAKRNGFPVDFGMALWETYVRSAHLASRGHPSLMLSYNELIKNPSDVTRRVVEKLADFGVAGIALPQKVALDEAVDASLYRQRQISPELDELLTPSQQRLLAALAQGDATNPALFESLSSASRLRMQEWARREGAIVALRAAAAEGKRAKAEVGKRDERLKAEQNRAKALDGKAKALDGKLAELKVEAAKIDEQFQAEQRRVEALEDELANKEAALANLNHEIGHSTVLLQHERMPFHKAFVGGMRAAHATRQNRERGRWALYLHYLLVRRRKDAGKLALLAGSGFFDPGYYLKHNRDVDESGLDPLIHFVDFGAAERRDPSWLFSTNYYLQRYPDAAASNINPLLHFLTYGRSEGRRPKSPASSPARSRSRALPRALWPQRVVVYTAVVAGYDSLSPPGIRPPNWDFVAFSDQPVEADGWEVRPVNYLHQDPTRTARFVKLHPHIHFPDYDHSIWLDANIRARGDLRTFLSRLRADAFMAAFDHPLRKCVYAEADACIERKKDHELIIRRQVERYRADGFPENAGLWETGVLVRRHNDPACVALMTAWWRELEIGSRRDQLSLPVVTRRLSLKIASLDEPGLSARDHPQLTFAAHLPQRIVPPDGKFPAVVRKSADINRSSVDFGVCVHNSPNEVQACLTSLIAARRPQDGIVIVDDASDGPTATLLDDFTRSHQGIKLIRHKINQGYTQSANDVLMNTHGDWAVLINSDAVVPPRALLKLIEAGEQFPALGIVGPLSNAASWQTVPTLYGPDGFCVNEIPPYLTVADMDQICEELSTGVVAFVPLVNGFCYAVRRSVIEKIGYFDEARFPIGYGEEDDYCLRAGAAGFLCGIATNAYVYHIKSVSFTSERRKGLALAGQKWLQKKHTGERVAAATAMMRRHPELTRLRELIAERLQVLASQRAAS
jgi:O-antigen biosynthesis protein